MLLLRRQHDHGGGGGECEHPDLLPALLMLSIWRALLAAGVAGFLFGCSKPAPKPHELTIQFTGDVDGRLVPCGCFTGQLGGLTRIATLFGPPGEHDTLRLDIGDAIEGPADYQRIEHHYLIRAFAEMGYS